MARAAPGGRAIEADQRRADIERASRIIAVLAGAANLGNRISRWSTQAQFTRSQQRALVKLNWGGLAERQMQAIALLLDRDFLEVTSIQQADELAQFRDAEAG